jgi:hypothetical protein
MIIQLNKKILDIILLSISAFCVLLFPYSYSALIFGVICAFTVVATENKVISWLQKHFVFNLVYGILLLSCVALVSITSLFHISDTIGVIIYILAPVMLGWVIIYGISKKRPDLSIILTYIIMLMVFFCINIPIDPTFILIVISLLMQIYMIKTSKKYLR